MYAIIETGGKQYRVEQGDIIDVELLDAEEGAKVTFDTLFVHDGGKPKVGAPFVHGLQVHGEVLGASAGPKITSVKYKPRHNERRKFGHRQHYTRVRITTIAA